MSSVQTSPESANGSAPIDAGEMKLEVVVIPVSDTERAKQFYEQLGWRLDADFAVADGYRVVQLTPPGSATSVTFGEGTASAAPGTTQELLLAVGDIDATRAELIDRGAAVSEVFHDETGAFHHAGTVGRVSGADPERRSYGSFASFSDPDGNGWVLQEVTKRAPGRANVTSRSVSETEAALRRAAIAHGEHEKKTGEYDPNWPTWYAEYMVREEAGDELPT